MGSSVLVLLVCSFYLVALSVAMPQSDVDLYDGPVLDVINTVEEDDTAEDAPFDHPGFGYANTPQKLQALGIDTRSVHPSILEDAQLLVVSEDSAAARHCMYIILSSIHYISPI